MIRIIRNRGFHHQDPRRKIMGAVGPFDFNMGVAQIKHIQTSDLATGFVVGNHSHLASSGQWEVVVILGDSGTPLFHFRGRCTDGSIVDQRLFSGDTVYVPPGASIALMSLEPGASLLEISNMEFDPKNYSEDILF